MGDIKYLVMDVDGTLTDGKIYIGEHGELMKAFSVKDGYGIGVILRDYCIIPVIITGRMSKIVENRCREIGVEKIYQGIGDKTAFLKELIPDLSKVAYMGDDLNDLDAMIEVRKHGGITGCPSDAVTKVRQHSDYISMLPGGGGAVRDFIDWIIIDNSARVNV